MFNTVSRELSSSDKAVLEEEGASLPQLNHRKRKSKHFDGDQSGSRKQPSGTTILGNTTSETQWEEIKQYLDPNPHLKGVDKGRYATKVSRYYQLIRRN